MAHGGFFQRHQWLSRLAGFATAVAVAGIPLLVLDVQSSEVPSTRLAVTGNRISALHVDSEHRVLIINSSSRADARAFPGQVSRPWEDGADVIIAPANDFAAPGIIESVERMPDARVIVAGIPGADQNWLTLERSVNDDRLTFVDTYAGFNLENSHVLITGSSSNNGPGVLIRANSASLFMKFDDASPPPFADVVVTGPEIPQSVPVTIRPRHLETPEIPVEGSVVTLNRGETATLVFEPGTIRVRGVTPLAK